MPGILLDGFHQRCAFLGDLPPEGFQICVAGGYLGAQGLNPRARVVGRSRFQALAQGQHCLQAQLIVNRLSRRSGQLQPVGTSGVGNECKRSLTVLRRGGKPAQLGTVRKNHGNLGLTVLVDGAGHVVTGVQLDRVRLRNSGREIALHRLVEFERVLPGCDGDTEKNKGKYQFHVEPPSSP
jgi:hypothetical protein